MLRLFAGLMLATICMVPMQHLAALPRTQASTLQMMTLAPRPHQEHSRLAWGSRGCIPQSGHQSQFRKGQTASAQHPGPSSFQVCICLGVHH